MKYEKPIIEKVTLEIEEDVLTPGVGSGGRPEPGT
jgi:hypothetical protein